MVEDDAVHAAFANKGITKVTIPDTIHRIGNYVFSYNKLTSVTIPDTVTSIGLSAFSNNRLTSVIIPAGVWGISSWSFCWNVDENGVPTLKKVAILNPTARMGDTENEDTVEDVFVNSMTPDFTIYGYEESIAEKYVMTRGLNDFKVIKNITVEAIPAQAYKGTARTPNVVVKDGTTTLTKGTDYTLIYKNNVYPGTATVTVNGIGDTYWAAKAIKTFKITAPTPKKMSTPSVSKYSCSKVKVRFDNIYGETGYQISRAKTSKGIAIVSTFSTSGKTKIVNGVRNKTRYFRIRAYRTVNGKRFYGPWSNAKAYKLR